MEPNKPTILVVDDEIGILKLLAYALRIYGFGVLTADEGGRAVETFLRHRTGIELVLLDVHMPRWDGTKTLVELRRMDPAVPVAFMSATPHEFTSAELLRLGVAHMFEKPFLSLVDLANTLKKMIVKKNRVD
jgi:DNA-binding response OmpR family regulator